MFILFNFCAAELFVSISRHLKLKIAKAIFSFKSRKIIWLAEHLSQTILRISAAFDFG